MRIRVGLMPKFFHALLSAGNTTTPGASAPDGTPVTVPRKS